MGSVHDEEPDCCKSKHCCCNGLEDQCFLNNLACMKLRKNGTARIATGAFVGIIVGILISLSAPLTPFKGGVKCQYRTDPAFSPASGFGCNDYWKLETPAKNALSSINSRRHFELCTPAHGKHYLAPVGGSCLPDPTLTFATTTGRETKVCYDSTSGYAVVGDDAGCSAYKAAFPHTAADSSGFITLIPGKASNPSSGERFCLKMGVVPSKLEVLLAENAICTNASGVVIESSKETVANSIALLSDFEAAQKKYRDILYYLFQFPGNLWLNGLKLIVMPLLVANIITSVAQLRETSAAGSVKLAWMTALYYLTTTVAAAIESLILVQIMLIPNMKDVTYIIDISKTKPDVPYANTGEQIASVINSIVPINIVDSMQDNNFLGIIFFSIVIGAVVQLDSKFLKFFSDLNTMMLRLVRVFVLWTPLGVFFMLTYAIAFHELTHLATNVGLFLGTVIVGLMFHLFVVYPTIYFFLTRRNPFTLLRNIIPAMCMALSVSSSIATYPITLQCAVLKNKFNRDIAKFVLTLGATVNMDGTTIGFPVAVVFVAYAQGYTLGFGQLMLIVILSTVSSMGAAPVPQAGLVLLIVIIENLQIEMGPVFSLIIAVDWLYDRPETMVNICGDSFAVGIMDYYLHSHFEEPKKMLEDEGVSS